MMTATQIISRARFVSELPSSKFVSHFDELQSLNEAWKQIYAALMDNDDDFYVNETTFAFTAALLVANTTQEYLSPLPEDFLRDRYLDFRGNFDWTPIRKFPLSMKDLNPAIPYYRIKNSSLWVIGSNGNTSNFTVRMGYYPRVATITAPQAALPYGTSYAPNLFALVTAPGYSPYLQQIVYAYNAIGIRSESITSNTVTAPVALFTEATVVTNIVYYKGTLYYIRGGLIWYKATDLTVLFVAPTQATTPAGVTSFFIINNTIYYTNATQIRSCDLTGGTDTLISATVAVSVAVTSIGGITTVFYTTAAGLLGSIVNAVSLATTLYATTISDVQSDGTNLYVRDTGKQLRKLVLAFPPAALITVTSDTLVDTDVLDMGQPIYDAGQTPPIFIIPLITAEGQKLLGFDASIDYPFTYPNNLVPEIMAWQCALDWLTSQGLPTAAHETRISTMWDTFRKMIRRDDYSVERIRNMYPDLAQGVY
jgi:hypothetical protein